MMVDKVKTNYEKESVVPVPYKRKVRLLLWGGAATPGDNSAFEWATRNVIKDYKATDKSSTIEQHQIRVAQDIIKHINGQEDGSLRSLDLFTHGGMQALYLTTASPSTNKALRYVLHNSSLYRSRTRMILNAAGWTKGSALIGEITFAKFTTNAKIELHGCKTAGTESDDDNITADFSTQLAKAGKSASVVIGHADQANPNINGGGEKNSEQDYRHGQRVIFSKGKIIQVTKQKRHLAERDLEALAKKSQP
ncbi:hypothetical protein [Janthinobacterium lividum]|uniref:Uncharacterized protein n=1 Tax=Janthinobacterium lividum TaxID=29581 RepID=A0ABU0XW69_9BURK|nr:hypothetical protein [Janthinobacterium lividum]MDQ4627797.1 hypothetical protein [Janthinobacterium lividum]MDQ4676615.1 hypothetical protein [Janthinobacterium lividum]MDQ4686913.1 hypothetical protein [Janthinobacterium lividum]